MDSECHDPFADLRHLVGPSRQRVKTPSIREQYARLRTEPAEDKHVTSREFQAQGFNPKGGLAQVYGCSETRYPTYGSGIRSEAGSSALGARPYRQPRTDEHSNARVQRERLGNGVSSPRIPRAVAVDTGCQDQLPFPSNGGYRPDKSVAPNRLSSGDHPEKSHSAATQTTNSRYTSKLEDKASEDWFGEPVLKPTTKAVKSDISNIRYKNGMLQYRHTPKYSWRK